MKTEVLVGIYNSADSYYFCVQVTDDQGHAAIGESNNSSDGMVSSPVEIAVSKAMKKLSSLATSAELVEDNSKTTEDNTKAEESDLPVTVVKSDAEPKVQEAISGAGVVNEAQVEVKVVKTQESPAAILINDVDIKKAEELRYMAGPYVSNPITLKDLYKDNRTTFNFIKDRMKPIDDRMKSIKDAVILLAQYYASLEKKVASE